MVDQVLGIALRKSVRRTKNHDGYFEDACTGILRKSKEIIVLDVGGTKYYVLKSTFATWPTTRLSQIMRAQCVREILSLCDGFYPAFKSTEGRNEYFFNRNPTCFNSILDIYRMGKLHCNKTSCALSYLDDIEYWGFNELFLDPCCAIDYYVEKDACQKEREGEMAAKKKIRIRLNEEEFGNSCIAKLRKYVWNITEYPETSIWARLFGFVSLTMVLVSTTTFILQTMPELEDDSEYPIIYKVITTIDMVIIIFFTFEYGIRLICSPRKLKFFFGLMNMVDLLALIPFYLTLILEQMEDIYMIGKTGKIIRLVRVLRIMRIFKMVRHFAGLQSLAYTMQEAYKELGLLLMLVTFSAFIFSIIVYFNEKDSEVPFTLFDGMMWSVMTISTVGSDANQPTSSFGVFFGGLCPIIGVFILSLPVPIIVNSFVTCYRNRIWRTEVRQKKEERIAERRKSDMLHIQQNFVKNLIGLQKNITTIPKDI